MAKRLHRGDFAIQDYIDLHGFTADQARRALDDFFTRSIRNSRLAVLVVHGRGRGSPGDPILKTKVFEWLTRGAWRKWVIAFASARSVDGGAGATYVLLRRRPLPKKYHKNRNS